METLWTWMSSSIGQLNGKVIFLVHFKPGNIEWLKMPTRKRVLQEWKKSFKVRLVFGHSKIPMEVRKTFKKDLHVPIMFALQTTWCYSGQRKISSFTFQKNWISFFPMQSSFSFTFKTVYHRREEYQKTDIVETKKKLLKIVV